MKGVLHPLNPSLLPVHLSLDAQDDIFRFGRHTDCQLAFPADFRISSFHAHLVRSQTEDRIAIVDTSVNGTFVNGDRVPRNERRTLQSGDEIFLVIPNREMLVTSGYQGSLTGNFVGYTFFYVEDVDASSQRQNNVYSASDSADVVLPLTSNDGRIFPVAPSSLTSASDELLSEAVPTSVTATSMASNDSQPGIAPVGLDAQTLERMRGVANSLAISLAAQQLADVDPLSETITVGGNRSRGLNPSNIMASSSELDSVGGADPAPSASFVMWCLDHRIVL